MNQYAPVDGAIRILVLAADDDRTRRLRENLRAEGFDVTHCDSLKAARDRLGRNQMGGDTPGQPAVVVADLSQAHPDPADFCRELTALCPRARLVSFGHDDVRSDRLMLQIYRAVCESLLTETQEAEAFRQLADRAVHEFDNILTAVLGNAEILRELLRNPSTEQAAIRTCVEQIEVCGRRGAGLMRSLLECLRSRGAVPRRCPMPGNREALV
jgi:CheY-like chemotaxis protein